MSSPIDLTAPTPPAFRTRLSFHDSDDEPLAYPSFSHSRLAIPRRGDSYSRGSSAASGSAGGPSNLAPTATASGSSNPNPNPNPNPNFLSRLTRQSSPATDEELAEDFRDLRDHDYPIEDDGEVENLFGGTGLSVRETRTAPRDQRRARARSGSEEDNQSTAPRRLGSLLNNPRRAGARRPLSPSAGDQGITAAVHRRGNRTERFRSPSSEPLSSAPASPPLSPAAGPGPGPSNAQAAVPAHLPAPVPITQVTGADARRRAIVDAMRERRAERAERSQGRGAPGLEVRPMAPLPRRPPGAGTGAGTGARDVIDLANESDDEEFEVTGANITARQRPVLSRQASGQDARGGVGTGQQARFPEARRGLHALNEVLERRRRQAEAIFNDEADERRRAVLSPPAAAAPQPPIRLGGAVFRAGNRQINYEAQPAGGPNRPRHRAVRTPSPPPGGRGGRHFGDMDGGAHGIFDRLFNFLPGLGGDHHPAGFADLLMGALPIFAGGNGAGPAGIRREDDVQAIIAAVPEFQYPEVPADFTRDFEVVDKQPIALDDNGKVIPSTSKPFLACAKCGEPLLLSSAYRSPGDRVWALRCGHMVDQRCLDEMSTPTTSAELAKVLPPMGEPLDMPDTPVRRGRKKARVSKKEASAPRVFNYTCPVKGCGKVHAATQSAGQQGWAQREGDGALQAYA